MAAAFAEVDSAFGTGYFGVAEMLLTFGDAVDEDDDAVGAGYHAGAAGIGDGFLVEVAGYELGLGVGEEEGVVDGVGAVGEEGATALVGDGLDAADGAVVDHALEALVVGEEAAGCVR